MSLLKMSSLTPLLIAAGVAMSLGACSNRPTATKTGMQAYRYQANADSPTFLGSTGFQQGQLDSLLKNNQLADPLTLLVGANTAMKQGRLTDAGVLYQQAQIRRLTDLQRFPPTPEAQASVTNLNRLRSRVSASLGAKLLERPRSYAQIAQRLERWRCETGAGYTPNWAYHRVVPAVSCARTQQQKVRLMGDLAVLMAQADYASAAQLAEYYQSSSSSVRELSGLKESYLRAIATMRTIERQQKRMGLSTRF